MTKELSLQLREKATYNLIEGSQFGYCISEIRHPNFNVLPSHGPMAIMEVQYTVHLSSVADPLHLDADTDPTFHSDSDPDPDPT